MKIRPLGDRVLVEPIEEKEQTVGGIIIPDAAKEKPMQGKVIAVGKKLDKDGKEIKFDVKKGDTVCIIEAMKCMNEIQAEEDGVIAEILAKNGALVEYDQPLFSLE